MVTFVKRNECKANYHMIVTMTTSTLYDLTDKSAELSKHDT